MGDLFESADSTGDGNMSLEELQTVIQDPHLKAVFAILELDVSEVTQVFRLLDDGDGVVSFAEFLEGVMKLRGGSKKMDVMALLHENRRIMIRLDELQEELHKLTRSAQPSGPVSR